MVKFHEEMKILKFFDENGELAKPKNCPPCINDWTAYIRTKIRVK